MTVTGRFERQESRFRGWVEDFAPGRYQLYVALGPLDMDSDAPHGRG